MTISFSESRHVRDTVGINADDFEIWNYARENGFTILTKDNDFDELSQINGCPPKVIHLSCGNKPTLFISNLLLSYEKEIRQFVGSDTDNCLMKILTD